MSNLKLIVAGSVMTLTLLAGGCSRKSSPDVAMAEAHPAQSATDLQARLDSAMKIPIAEARDGTLQQVAKDAAASGQVDLCGTSLSKISVPELRHSTTDLCSAALTQAGNSAGATKLKTLPGVQ